MRRVTAYVDGFNLYHAIDDLKKPYLKWLDLHKLAADLCASNETLIGVHYFTAYATWLPPQTIRHREYVKALRHVGVKCQVGHFKSKARKCRACGITWTQHEEKESDVAMAVQLVADAFNDVFDRALVITADSDLKPPIRTINAQFPAKAINVIAPPGRMAHARDLSPIMQITAGRLARALLPETATDGSGATIFTRPPSYAPPTI
jgi:uncharacterized LabA/DUF88 family protein